MEPEELDKKFDQGEDISQYLDLSKARRMAGDRGKVTIDLPAGEIRQQHKETKRLGKE